jgi:citrate lyase subunit beta / citryl-CoA lyase
MRSKLFVPGTHPQRFEKALAAGADAVSIDLEDAVPADAKEAARAAVGAFVHGAPARGALPTLIVRCNGVGTPAFEADLRAVAGSAAAIVNLPKVEDAAAVLAAAALLERIEAGTPPLKLLCTIETPKGLRQAASIALAHPRVCGLQLGLGDLFEPHGIRRADAAAVHAAMFALRMAAAEAGVMALDGAHPAIDDEAGFRDEALMAQALGFSGKSCIHPKQVAWAHAVFAPDAAALAQAQRIVDAAAAAGEGAFVVDGRMVDAPYLARARALLADAAARGAR